MFTLAVEFHFPHAPKLQQHGNADIGSGGREDHTFGRAARMSAAEPCRIEYQLACSIWVGRVELHFAQVLAAVAVDMEAHRAGKVKRGVSFIQLRSRMGNAYRKAALPVVALKPITDVVGQ